VNAHFSSHTLAEIFRDLFLQERSGVLHLSRGDVHKRVYFDRGMILFGESADEDEDLGPRLLREGKISAGALAEARRNVSEAKDLAQALVNRDLIGKENLADTARFIVEKVVRSVFQWEGGSARFESGWLVQETFESDVVSTFEVILRGIETMVDFEDIAEALHKLDNRVRLRRATPVPIEMLDLSPTLGFVLSRADGTMALREVLSIVPPGEDRAAMRFLYGLLVLGVAELDPPVGDGPFRVADILREHTDRIAVESEQEQALRGEYQRVRDAGPLEILGVSGDSRPEEIENAYERHRVRFSRDHIRPAVRELLRDELAFVESRVLEAYLGMMQNRQAEGRQKADEGARGSGGQEDIRPEDLLIRPEMDKTQTKIAIEASRRNAEAYFQKARKVMREGDYHNAIQFAKLAISYHAEDARYYTLLADCQVRNPEARWQRMAEQNYLKATQIDPWSVDHWLRLGQFYKGRGLKLRARKQFEQALEVAPGNDTAVRELKGL